MKIYVAATIAFFVSGPATVHAADPVTQEPAVKPLTDCFYQGRRYSPHSSCTTSCDAQHFCSHQTCQPNGSWNPAITSCSWGINCPPKC